jgi:hypothetical protein
VPTWRQLVTAILLSQPGRDWHGWELANKLKVMQRNLLTQLGEWARLGFIRRTGAGTYALDTPTPELVPDHLLDQLTACSPGVVATPDGDEEPSKVQCLQQSEDERPCAATSAVHTDPTPESDTSTTSGT